MAAFSEIMEAFHFVSSAPNGMHTAVLNKDTGKIFYRSEMSGLDEINEVDDVEPGGLIWVEIPHRNDLDLGQELVSEFVHANLPDAADQVVKIFKRRGAYGHFKGLLKERGLLEAWYDFENSREEAALRQWCQDNEIELSESKSDVS